ncbi:hypothetical protein ABG768_001623 [Culter alburnus]|uniref:Immunoglobulin domain-containing protein n=1 Tax=Culter alburnus TaxID=194366 RepID=A0AAW2A164_CULAL
MRGYKMIILLAFLVNGAFTADPDEVSVNEGESVTLNSGLIRKQEETMLWYFNNILIVHINGDPEKTCFYYGEGGIFRDRLKVDYKTGSLTIINATLEHAGRYEAELIKSDSSGKKESLNRNSKCNSTKIIRKTSLGEIIKKINVTVKAPGKAEPQMDIKEQETDKTVPGSDLSAGAVAGIVVAILVVFAAAVGVIYYRRSKSRKRDEEKRKPELLLKV